MSHVIKLDKKKTPDYQTESSLGVTPHFKLSKSIEYS